MNTERLPAENILNKHDDRIMVFYKKALSAMEEYANQEIEYKIKHFIGQRDKALDERDNARIWIKSLQKERDEALHQSKQLQCENNKLYDTLVIVKQDLEHTPVLSAAALKLITKIFNQLNQKNEG